VNPAPLTHTAEDYLKEIHRLVGEQGRATTSALAERVGVSPPSATAMLKKLASLGLVEHELYRGVRLTEAGEKAAVEIIRHHRLLEMYLSQTLGLPIDELHAEADRLEHALSEELEARIDAQLGYPTHDPHGDPIPDAELNLPASSERVLSDLEPGERATVRRVPDGDTELLRYLASLGLVPGEDVELVGAEPFGGPVLVRAGGGERAISRELASQIGVD
jgi:DtxR family Mn-dependent transcriptional regulator